MVAATTFLGGHSVTAVTLTRPEVCIVSGCPASGIPQTGESRGDLRVVLYFRRLPRRAFGSVVLLRVEAFAKDAEMLGCAASRPCCAGGYAPRRRYWITVRS